MMERSLKLYLVGFISGLIVCFILIVSYPALYYAFLAALSKKVEVQIAVLGGNRALAISLNNMIASLIAAYGGYIMSRVFFYFDSKPQYRIKGLLGLLDTKSKAVPMENLRFYLALYALPAFALFINGFVLGAFFMLYAENLGAYFANLLPHGLFEVPGILFSGSIGLTIADVSVFDGGNLRKNLDGMARRQIPRYLLVLELLIISAFLEVLTAA
jgi:uncharacterized membrane protein SpoIIM required for sporulation